ncbi:MAG: hypothetical protein CVV27_04015 [Candidatus Melainabacteria bacterium HGW-Melainabacteria-1]|nr:MAG: hypothetical protein CVV27_04015 [Candidatus Melainabacteria bacterium HGW-Melainabacteria-1]
MHKFLLLCGLLNLLLACGPNPAANESSKLASPAGSGQDTAATARVLATKQIYISFLECAQNAEASAEHKVTIAEGIKNVSDLPDESFTALKSSLSISAQDFVSRYGSCVK